jgi:DNA primase
MQNFSNEQIDEVLGANDIAEVVSGYVKLEKKGKYLFGLCPFHNEKTPSFSVTPSKQIFYCYSCQKGGNVLHFIMELEKLRFMDALRFLAERGRVSLPENLTKEEEERISASKEMIKMNTDAARYFHQCLMDQKGKEAFDYLVKRKIVNSTIIKFGIGYALKDWDSLLNHLRKQGYTDKSIIASGLVIQNKDGKVFDRFRGRLMFPIFDIRGSVIGFGGRVLDDSLPKYMNSPETIIYHKARNLYGLNFVRKSGEKKIIIVEGYMDVVSLHQHGIINAVASLGTALTHEQGKLLRMYGEEIIISYDSDKAGQKATHRGLEIMEEIGCDVKVLKIPRGKDPDDFIKTYGKESFQKLLRQSVTFLEYKVEALKQELDQTSTAGQVDFLNKTADILSKISNSIQREMYIKKLALDYGIRESSLEYEVEKRMKKNMDKNTKMLKVEDYHQRANRNLPGQEEPKASKYKKILLCLLCLDNPIYKSVIEHLDENLFVSEEEGRLYHLVIEKIKKGSGIRPAEFLAEVPERDVSEFVAIFEKDCIFEDNKKAFLDILKKLELDQLKRRQEEILELLKKNEAKDEEYNGQLKSELSEILMKMKNFYITY